jgi:glycosyltransferase involved in cell wall biosynthesis
MDIATQTEPTHAPPLTKGRLVVLIPAFNEGRNVGAVVRQTLTVLPDADVVVIDDGSADGTAREAARAGAKVARLPVNLGYGAALQAGYMHAVRRRYEVVAQLDADGQHSAQHLRVLLDRFDRGDVDVVIGSRFLDRDGHYRPSWARKVGMAIFARIASHVTRQHITDPTSGFQVMSIDVAKFFCTEVYPADYPDADILILLSRTGFRICEVGVQMRPGEGVSMHSGHRSLYYVYKMSLSILMTLLRPSGPRH